MLGKLNLTFPIVLIRWRVGLERIWGRVWRCFRRKWPARFPTRSAWGRWPWPIWTLSSERKWYGLSASFSIRNLFDRRYEVVSPFDWRPASDIPQDTLRMDGRTYCSSCATISERTCGYSFLLFSIWLAGVCWRIPGVINVDRVAEADMKAAYIYNFGAFMEWPESNRISFNICTPGDDKIGRSLKRYEGKLLSNRRVVVARLNSMAAISDCQILFVGENEAA